MTTRPPAPHDPRGHRSPTVRRVVCAGDSLTAGTVSAPWVDALASSLGSPFDIVNAGKNGEVAWTLLQRLDQVISLRPDICCVLIGTNDVGAHLADHWLPDYVRGLGLPRAPSADWYRDVLTRILLRLRRETGSRVAVLTLPPIADHLDPSIEKRLAEYNEIVRATAHRTGTALLDLSVRLRAELPDGASLAPDGLHLSDPAGVIVRDLVENYVRTS